MDIKLSEIFGTIWCVLVFSTTLLSSAICLATRDSGILGSLGLGRNCRATAWVYTSEVLF